MSWRDDPSFTDDGAATDVLTPVTDANLPWPRVGGGLRAPNDTIAGDWSHTALYIIWNMSGQGISFAL